MMPFLIVSLMAMTAPEVNLANIDWALLSKMTQKRFSNDKALRRKS
jgi:hypothetical protein